MKYLGAKALTIDDYPDTKELKAECLAEIKEIIKKCPDFKTEIIGKVKEIDGGNLLGDLTQLNDIPQQQCER